MTNLCREAALGPIRDAAHDIQNIAVDQVRITLMYYICVYCTPPLKLKFTCVRESREGGREIEGRVVFIIS